LSASGHRVRLLLMDPIINLEETPGKTVGRRRVADGFRFGMGVQKAGASFRQALGVPKGVYRFHSHEEANDWLMTKIAEAAARKNRN
jgi:hypothetical protein